MRNFTEVFNDGHTEKLRHQLLFSGLTEHEIFMFIQHSKPLYKFLKEGSSLRITGKYSRMLGMVVSGSTNVYSIEYDGNKTLLKTIDSGQNSGTLYAMFDYYNALIELTAGEDCEILLISPEYLFIADTRLATIQQKILVNMLASQRETFLDISEHLTCLSQRSIRDKILRFLKIYSERKRSYNFEIPYSREELSNYLAVDRASLSRTLGELKREGIIDFRKNHFKILTTQYFTYS